MDVSCTSRLQSCFLGLVKILTLRAIVHGFVRSLGMLRDTAGIRVSAVAPGTVKVSIPVTVSPMLSDIMLIIHQTPLWTEAPDKKHLVENDGDLEILPETVAEAMSELCENPEYGNGMILEVMNDHRRVVSLFNADPPPPKAADMPAFVTITTELLERRLKKDGLDV